MHNNKLPFAYRLWMVSLFDILVGLVFVIMFMAHHTLKDYDLWWHLRTGQLLLSGCFPHADIFSYTAAGKEWILHEWGSEVIFYALYKQVGSAGILLLRALIAALVIGIVFKTMIRRQVNIFLALVLALASLLTSSIIWGERPHLFTVLFFTIMIYFYNEYRESNRKTLLYIVPPMFLLWVNLHGGYVIGFVFLAVVIAAQTVSAVLKQAYALSWSQIRNLIVSAVVAFGVCFMNPNTWRGVLYPLLYVGNQMPDFHQFIEEWNAASWAQNKDFILLFLFLTIMLAVSKIRPRLEQVLILLVFAYFAFTAQRHVGLFSLVVLPLFAPQVQDNLVTIYQALLSSGHLWLRRLLTPVGAYFSSRDQLFSSMEHQLDLHGTLMVVLLVVTLLIASGRLDNRLRIQAVDSQFPLEMTDYLKTHPKQGNLFNDYGWGGFVLWQIPEQKVFIDGRLDVYRKKITDDYFKVLKLQPGWQDVIRNYDITRMLLPKDQLASRFITRLSPEWRLEKETANALLFVWSGRHDR